MKRQSLVQRFAVPALIAVATLGGLVAGLMGDGVWDVLAAVGLALPVVVIAVMLRR
jgi:hypothetical protein